VVYLQHKNLIGMTGLVPEEEYTVPFGVADIKREGKDVTVVATATMVHTALGAAGKMAAEGIDAEVIDLRTLSPLDEDAILSSVKKTNRLVIIHEEVKFCGSGAEIAAMAAEKCFDHLDAPIIRIGAPFTPVPFASSLESKFIPSEDELIAAVKKVTSKR